VLPLRHRKSGFKCNLPTGAMLLRVGAVVNLGYSNTINNLRHFSEYQGTFRERRGWPLLRISDEDLPPGPRGEESRRRAHLRSSVRVHAESVIVPLKSFAPAPPVEYSRIPCNAISARISRESRGAESSSTRLRLSGSGRLTYIGNLQYHTDACACVRQRRIAPDSVVSQFGTVRASYADRNGKYQKHRDIVLPRI
jgi:hypothetical protein